MLSEKTVVQRAENGYVWLEPRQTDHCGKCSLNKGCGHRLIDFMHGKKDPLLRARMTEQMACEDIRAGDIVTVGVDEGKLIQIAGLMYGLPLITLIFLATLGSIFAIGEMLLLGLLVSGMAAAIWLSRKLARKLENNSLLALSFEQGKTLIPLKLTDSDSP